jgi:hypothetical protein
LKHGRAHARDRIGVAEQPQCFLALTLHHDHGGVRLTVLAQRVLAHPLGDLVELVILEQLVEHAHDVDDLAGILAHGAIDESIGHGAALVAGRASHNAFGRRADQLLSGDEAIENSI